MTISRRTIVAGAAWAVPAALVAGTATASTASAAGTCPAQPRTSYFSTPHETFVTVEFADSQLVDGPYKLTITHISGPGPVAKPAPKTFSRGYDPQVIFSVSSHGTYTVRYTITTPDGMVCGPSYLAFYHPMA